MSISPQTINSVKESSQIEHVVGDFVELEEKGSNLVGNCPFHDEKTPSFSVSPSKGIFKCFGCDTGGDSIKFIMQKENKTFPEAVIYLAKKYSIPIEEDQATPEAINQQKLKHEIVNFNIMVAEFYQKSLFDSENEPIYNYVNSRFSKKSIENWQIGFAPPGYTTLYKFAKQKGYKDEFLLQSGLLVRSKKDEKIYDFFQDRVVFPIWDKNKSLISFTGRSLPEANKKQAKYINLGDTDVYKKSRVLYGLNFAVPGIVKTDLVTLVEGNPDVVRLHEIGIDNTIAPSGTALSVEQIKLIKRFAKKVVLLYDGDNAGQNALIKNGKLLLENDLIPYAAVLPNDEDPDSFFKSKKQYNKWIDENQKDWISWFTNRLFSKLGDDPSIKNDAINEVCDILILVSSAKRQLYIDAITSESKIKGKLFSDRIKELEAQQAKRDEPKPVVPKNVNANDFEKWGFYENNNSYHFRTKTGISKLSNFIMRPIIHIGSITDSKRVYELVNEFGFNVVINFDMNEMTSLQSFQRTIESKGNFMFWGQMIHFQKLKLKLYEETRTCEEIRCLGWQKEGFWAWSNGIIDDDGNFKEVDEYGIVKYEDHDYFIPAFSKIHIMDKSIYIDERKFQYKKSSVSLLEWMELFVKVHGNNAMIGFAWYLSALFRDHILYLNDNFPLLNLFGQKGSGKNTLAYSLLSLFGKKQTEYNIHNGTKAGLAKHLEMFRNSIAFLDEYKNNIVFEIIETLKSIYNSIGRSRLNMDKGGKKEVTEVNQAVIVAGQEMPTINTALSSRMLFLEFKSKEGLSDEEKENFEKLQKMERDGLPHITTGFIIHRKYFIEHYKENYNAVLRHLSESTKNENVNDRILRNICTVIASFKTLEPKFKFSFGYYDLFTEGLNIAINHNSQLGQSDEIGVFWNLLESMFDEDLLIDKWHFNIIHKTILKTTQGKKYWENGKRILRFKFNPVAKLYAEQLRRRNEAALPQDSLQHYLRNSRFFIGIEKSCKFIRKDFDPTEHRVTEKKQTTTAYCFDYDGIGINLEREYEDLNENNNEQTQTDNNSKLPTINTENYELKL